MLDTRLKKARKETDGQSLKLLRWMRIFPPSIWIIITVIVLVGGRLIWVDTSRPHRQKIAAAFGAANTFLGRPQMNHDGSRFTYVAIKETKTCALYLYDTLSKQQREIVSVQTGLGGFADIYDLRAWAWSPDDSSFVYSLMGKLVICSAEAETNRVELTIRTNAVSQASEAVWLAYRTNAVSQVVWLAQTTLAYVEGGNTLCYAQKQSDGQWQQRQLPCYDSIFNLTAVATNTVAWLQDGFICSLNLDENLNVTNNPFLASTHDMLPTNGLTLWLDASTLQQSDQTPVNLLTDLSPSGNIATADGHPPLYNAPDSPSALNGKGTIHFSSSDSVNNATRLITFRPLGITGSAPRTIFAVTRRVAGKKMLISTGNIGNGGEYFGLCDYDFILQLPGTMLRDNAVPPVTADWNTMSVVYDGTTQSGFVNGVLKGTTAFPMNTTDAEVQLGLRVAKSGDAGHNAASDGDFAELLIYDRALDSAEQRQVEDYLERKWFDRRKLSAQSPLVWIDLQTNGITGFTRSKSTGQLLISVENGPDTTLWRYNFRTGVSRLALTGSIQNARWVGPKELAYIDSKSGHKELVFADISGTEKSRLFEHGNIDWFNPASAGGKLLISGAVSNEPANGIWQYDLETGQLQSLVPYSDHPSDDVKKIIPFHKSIQSPSGQSISCIIYPPATVDHHKKYPLVISDTRVSDVIHGPMFHSAIAACGAYVAIVERPNWGAEIGLWGQNVLALYQNLKQDPTIDFGQVYLFSASAETKYMSEFVEKTPGLWKGIILLNPGQLPDFSNSPRFQRRPKILITAGGEEHRDEQFKKYQEDALKDGVIVEYIISPGETHIFVGKAAKLERAKAVEHFIFEE